MTPLDATHSGVVYGLGCGYAMCKRIMLFICYEHVPNGPSHSCDMNPLNISLRAQSATQA